MTKKVDIFDPPYPPTITIRRGGKDEVISIVPRDVDVRHFPCMPLNVVALFQSGFFLSADDHVFRAGLTLWGRSWHQVPAASLPDDDRALSRLAGLGGDLRRWRHIRERALHGFIRCNDGRIYHPIIAKYALDAMRSSRRASLNGQLGGRPRQGIENATSDESDGFSPQKPAGSSDQNPQQSSDKARIGVDRIEVSKKESRPRPSRIVLTNDEANSFAAFWLLYPRRVGRPEAEKSWVRAIRKPGVTTEIICTAVRAYAASRSGEDSKFTRHPATWLNNEGWNDETLPPSGSVAPRRSNGEVPYNFEAEDTRWRVRVRSFVENDSWVDLWGPKPTEFGCCAPEAVLVEAGFIPKARRTP